jgi:hypothetical protein
MRCASHNYVLEICIQRFYLGLCNAIEDEAEMSEAKESKPKRPIAGPKPAETPAEGLNPAASPNPAALTKPAEAGVALPQVIRRQPPNTADEMLATYRGAVAAIGESQRAVANGVKALALEVTGMAHANLTAAGDSTAALIGTRNFADAVEIQLGFARRSIEAAFAGTARLNDIGARLASDASRPIVAPLSKAT